MNSFLKSVVKTEEDMGPYGQFYHRVCEISLERQPGLNNEIILYLVSIRKDYPTCICICEYIPYEFRDKIYTIMKEAEKFINEHISQNMLIEFKMQCAEPSRTFPFLGEVRTRLEL